MKEKRPRQLIMIVDDNMDMLTMLRLVLKKKMYLRHRTS